MQQVVDDAHARFAAESGATLADGGTNPLTRDRIIDPENAHSTLAVRIIAGMYESSGDRLFDLLASEVAVD